MKLHVLGILFSLSSDASCVAKRTANKSKQQKAKVPNWILMKKLKMKIDNLHNFEDSENDKFEKFEKFEKV